MGKRAISKHVGAVSPSVKINRMLAAVFKGVYYNVLGVETTETTFYWVYGIETKSQRRNELMNKQPKK